MNVVKILVIASLSYLVIACGGAEDRKAAYLEKADKSLNSGDLDKARIELKNVLQIDPKDARAYFKLGTIFERKQEFRQAFGSYSKAAELDPGNPEYESKLGRFYLVLAGDIEKATEKMDLILSKDANNLNGLLLKAGILLKQDKSEEAKSIAKSLFDKHSDNVEIALFLSTIYTKDKEYTDAISVLDQAITRNPDNESLLSTLGNALFVNKELDRSEKIWKQILNAHPDVFKNHLSLAQFYQRTQQPDKAEKVLRDAIVADESDVSRKIVLIEYIQQIKGNEAAINELEVLVKNNPGESSLRLALANLQYVSNDTDNAIQTFKNIAKDFSNEEAGITSRVNLAKIFMQNNEVEAATAIIEEAAEIAPNDSEVNLVKAKIAMRNNNIQQAIISLRTVVKNNPENIEAYILLSASHKANGEVSQSEDVMARAYENNRENIKALLPLAKYHAQNKNIDDAEKAIDDYLRLDGNNYEALSIKSSILNSRKKYQEAFDLAENLIRLYPDKDNGYIQSVPKLVTDKKNDDAITLLSRGYEKAKSITLLKLMAEIQIGTNKADDAIASLQLIDDSNSDEGVYLLLAKAYASKNDAESAKQALLNSIKQDKTRVQSYLSLSGMYFNENNIQKSTALLEEGYKANPKDLKLGVLLGGYYERSGNIDEAINLYEKILTNNPNNLIVTNNLAALLSEHKQDKDSIERAVELASTIKNSTQPVIKDTVGWVYYKAGKYGDAIDVLNDVVASEPGVPVFNYHLGMAYYKSGDKDNARKYLEKSLNTDNEFPGIEVARNTLKQL